LGVILRSIGALIVELAAAREFVRLSLRWAGGFPARQLSGFVAPLFVVVLSQWLIDKGNLVAVQALGATPTEEGTYSVAQNLAVVRVLVAAVSPLLLSTLSRIWHSGGREHAKKLDCSALRAVVCLLPFADLMAGAASVVVTLVVGSVYLAVNSLRLSRRLGDCGQLSEGGAAEAPIRCGPKAVFTRSAEEP
jgi:hypothetical protein